MNRKTESGRDGCLLLIDDCEATSEMLGRFLGGKIPCRTVTGLAVSGRGWGNR